MRKFFKFIFTVALIGVLLFALFIGAVYAGFFGKLPTKQELKSIQHEEASIIYSIDGKIIGKIFAENRTQVDSASMPKHLLDALIATEDRRYYEHEGVDYKSYVRVILRSIILQDKSGGGGSTITQQLIKNLYGRSNFGLLTMPVVKTKEAIIAGRMEEVYTKNQILVLYFNTVPFGENVYGVEAASLRYFNKHINQVTVQQAALLVGMLKANTAFNPRLYPEAAKQRRNTVLALMQKEEFISAEESELAKASSLGLDYTNYALYNPAGHFARKVEQEAEQILTNLSLKNSRGEPFNIKKDGLVIKTTLHYGMQQMAVASVKKQLIKKQKTLDKELRNSATYKAFLRRHATLKSDTVTASRRVFSWSEKQSRITKLDSAWQAYKTLHAAMLAVDPNSGAIRVWVGSNNYHYVPYDLVLAKRQAASAFKPIVYAAALQQGLLPCDYFSNEERVYEEFDNWQPQNYDGKSGDETAMWYSLTRSLNLPTVDLFFKTGYNNIRLLAADLDLDLPVEEQPSIALGATSTSLAQLTQAYSVFAAGGIKRNVYSILSISTKSGQVLHAHKAASERVLNDSIVAQLNRMLVTAVEKGTGRSLHSRYGVEHAIAGKTGTAQNYSDAWFMSYTPNLVVGTWVGAMSPKVHFKSGANGSGSALALPISARFYKQIEKAKHLRKTTLAGFEGVLAFDDSTDCAATRDANAINRFIDKVVPGNEERKARREQRKAERNERKRKKEQEEGWVRRTWKKVFKKK